MKSWLARRFRQPLFLLLTVPAGIALSIGVLSYVLIWLERRFPVLTELAPDIPLGVAEALLTVIAGAAMTALGLTYSLTLLVFTLAASAIGPRLLKRFTSDPINQVTAGVFGGCFLFALATMAQLDKDDPPDFTILTSCLLAVLTILQLIFFVRHVAGAVSVDDEVASISARLTEALADRRSRYVALSDVPEDARFETEIAAETAGYVGELLDEAVLEAATDADVIVKVKASSGQFVLAGDRIIGVAGEPDDDALAAIKACLSIEPSRSESCRVEFSIHLLVEIGLRALSPGVNDPFTAIAVVDALSGGIATACDDDDDSDFGLKDTDGKIRLLAKRLSPKDLIGQAFHPLRAGGARSILLQQSLARAYGRMYAGANTTMRATLEEHVALLRAELDRGNHLSADVDSVLEFLPADLREVEATADKCD